ncbi:MAG: metallophosphoesterase [Oscillospiraceae bacterium]|jgi:hypothetical protein|nr:metallophosphoesterase [Oscillospiraceae bacterium]
MKLLKSLGKSFHTRIGAYVFFALAAVAIAALHSAKSAFGWIAELYPQGFVTTLFWALGVCAALTLIFLLGAEKFNKNRALCAVHTVLAVLTGIFFGYTLALMLGEGDGLTRFIADLPFLGVAIGLPFVLLLYPNFKKAAQVVCAVLISAAVLVSVVFVYVVPAKIPFAFSANPLVLDIGGDNYSIVFATNRNSTAYLTYTLGDEKITVPDASFGRLNVRRVHHFVVPRGDLNGGNYSVRAVEVTSSINAITEFGGALESRIFNFKGDYKDALNILIASDWHDQPEKLLAASANFPAADLFIMLGDFASNYNSDDEFIINTIAAGADATNSEIPAVYVRGNHELYGEMTDIIFPLLGLDSFYYQVQRGKYLFTVCDGAEGGEAASSVNMDAESYRAQELAWLESLPVPPKGTFHFAAIHVPNFDEGSVDMQNRFFDDLARLGTDLQVSGHEHWLEYPAKYANSQHPILVDGGPTEGYSGDYICSMAQVSANGTVRLTAFTTVGEQKLDVTVNIE